MSSSRGQCLGCSSPSSKGNSSRPYAIASAISTAAGFGTTFWGEGSVTHHSVGLRPSFTLFSMIGSFGSSRISDQLSLMLLSASTTWTMLDADIQSHANASSASPCTPALAFPVVGMPSCCVLDSAERPISRVCHVEPLQETPSTALVSQSAGDHVICGGCTNSEHAVRPTWQALAEI